METWNTVKTLKDIAGAYQSIYEKKEYEPSRDKDGDGDNDFADNMIARMVASGMSREEAIKKVKNKSYNKKEVEAVDEKYIGFKKLEASIAAKGGVRNPAAVAASIGRKKYGNKKFQNAAATDHKLNEAYEAYEFVASYLLENNFANTIEDANAIINNMSEGWFESIMEEKGSLPIAKMKRKETELLGSDEEHFATLNTPMGSPERKKAMKNLDRFDNINTARRSVATRGGKRPLPMPEVGRYRSKDED